jgi:hypothetical protein
MHEAEAARSDPSWQAEKLLDHGLVSGGPFRRAGGADCVSLSIPVGPATG